MATITFNFLHDPQREKFSSRLEYLVAIISCMFVPEHFLTAFILTHQYGFLEFWVVYLTLTALFTYPMLTIQTFVGQFSGTGFISCFRMAPIMKGLSYVMLIHNLKMMTVESGLLSDKLLRAFSGTDKIFPAYDYGMVGINFVIWGFGAVIVLFGIRKYGKILLFTSGVPVFILTIGFLSYGLVNGILFAYGTIISHTHNFYDYKLWLATAGLCVRSLGTSNGILVTLGSCNMLRDDPKRNAFHITIVLAILNIITMLTAAGMNADFDTLQIIPAELDYNYVPFQKNSLVFNLETFQPIYQGAFYLFMFFLSFNQLMTNLILNVISLTDEFVILRKYKLEFVFTFCLLMFSCSIFYCLKQNVWFLMFTNSMAPSKLTFAQLILAITILWFYGQKRFLKDYQIIVEKHISKQGFKLMKFILPAILVVVFALYLHCELMNFGHLTTTIFGTGVIAMQLIFFVGPFVLIPVYIIYIIFKHRGNLKDFKSKNLKSWNAFEPVLESYVNLAEEENTQKLDDTIELETISGEKAVVS